MNVLEFVGWVYVIFSVLFTTTVIVWLAFSGFRIRARVGMKLHVVELDEEQFKQRQREQVASKFI